MTKFYHSYFSPPILGGITPLFDYSFLIMDIVIQVLVALISTLKSCLLMTKFYHSYFSPPILGGITPLFDYSLMLI